MIMNEIINQINAWIPTITSIIAVVATSISARGNLRNTVRSTLHSAHSTLEYMKSDKSFKECAEELRKLSAENRELNRRIAILTDRIAKIEGYSDMIGGE